jgi:hypothetical protein
MLMGKKDDLKHQQSRLVTDIHAQRGSDRNAGRESVHLPNGRRAMDKKQMSEIFG